MAQSGASVAIMCRNLASAAETIEELEQFGGVHRAYEGDVTKQEDAKRVVAEEVVEDYGRIDVLVNNAGIATLPLIPWKTQMI